MRYVIQNKSYEFYVGALTSLTPLPHIHTHLELIYLAKGSGSVTLNSRSWLIEEGGLCLAAPNQIHFYENHGPLEGYMLIFSAEMDDSLQHILEGRVPVVPVLPAHCLPADIGRQMEQIRREQTIKSEHERVGTRGPMDGTQYDGLVAKGHTLALLGQVLARFAWQQADNATSPDSIKEVLRCCLEEYTEPITLESVASRLHLSKYYISHMFKERMNCSFADFVNGLRVDHACRMLMGQSSVAQAALDSGFGSVRTFNRVFRKFMNTSPRDYVRDRRERKTQREEIG